MLHSLLSLWLCFLPSEISSFCFILKEGVSPERGPLADKASPPMAICGTFRWLIHTGTPVSWGGVGVPSLVTDSNRSCFFQHTSEKGTLGTSLGAGL